MNLLRLMRSTLILVPLASLGLACDVGVVGEEPDTAGDEGGDPMGECDPDLACGEAETCVDGLLYPTTCGPQNCDESIGECEGSDPDPGDCDPMLACGEVLSASSPYRLRAHSLTSLTSSSVLMTGGYPSLSSR